ncbi:hypothetical protein [Flavobacterium sp. GT3P67]|uniref:hypothetical protein n=1 Tax=Flavobacterium sp. GT3P67 TaxID=2541722 RepID=UPI001053E7E5|nr:hypothetical protein [Flavobacterium sp. GT3P67]TDE54851.1 hypothetical protein E0H99_00640 [Flavobacterium sp. GT3P67]
MENKNIDILNRLEVAFLERLKSEAEFVLEEMNLTESITTNKAFSLFQILIVMLVSVIGFLTSQLTYIDFYSFIIQACLIFGMSLCISIGLLLKIIYPTKTRLKGSIPRNILQSDIFDGSKYETENFLSNKIISLDNAILKNQSNQEKRIFFFKTSIWSFLIGLIVIICFGVYTIS